MEFDLDQRNILKSNILEKNKLENALSFIEDKMTNGKKLYIKLKHIENKIYEFENNTRLHNSYAKKSDLVSKLEKYPILQKKLENELSYIREKIYLGKNLYIQRDQIKLDIEIFENNDKLHKSYNNSICQIELLNKKINELENLVEKEEKIFIDNLINNLGELKIQNHNYLFKCVQIILCSGFSYSQDSYINTIRKNYYKIPSTRINTINMTEQDIIIEAHKIYNYYLIYNNGPYNFYHNHNNYKLCKWDGYSKRCRCTCKCPEWNYENINWLTDINLDKRYPIGKAKCGW